jgi:uncharacterized protein YbjT (DUF2867 family)
MKKVAVIGGNGRVGRIVVERLSQRPDVEVVSLGRKDPTGPEVRAANVTFVRSQTLDDIGRAIADATHIVNCASLKLNAPIYKNHSKDIERVVLVGSTRTYTAFDDPHAAQLREQEAEFHRSGLPGVMVQPSLIYGGSDKNISRVAYFLTLTPLVPLPNGGRSLIQPVHYEDVALSVEAALFAPNAPGKPIIVAGPRAIPIREMIEIVARGIGRTVRVVSVPSAFLYAAAAVTRALPGIPNVSKYQVQRMLEDRAFDITDMRERLGINPRPFEIDKSILDNWRK